MSKQVVLFFTLIFCCSLLGCIKDDERVVAVLNPETYSKSDQLKIGHAIDAKLSLQYELLDSENPGMDYLRQNLNLILQTSDVENRSFFEYQLSVVDDTTNIHAFTLPNGHIYIYSGLLKTLGSESQLLALLASEIAYVELGTTIETMENDDNIGPTELGDILLNNGHANLDFIAETYPDLSFEAEMVTQADTFAIKLLCPFAYEPIGIARYISKTENEALANLWLEKKQWGDFPTRIESIYNWANPCGLDGVKNIERYQSFLEDLIQ